MDNQAHVVKKDGSTEPLQLSKTTKMILWAAEGTRNVSTSQIEMGVQNKMYNGVSTSDIQETLVTTAAGLISAATPDYSKVAARLLLIDLRKKAYGSHVPPKLGDHIHNLVCKGKYDKVLLSFPKEAIDVLDAHINHDLDWDYEYAAATQWASKYLIQNRVTKEVFESPNMALMVLSMWLYHEDHNVEAILKLYNALSQMKISLPTPIMAGVRSPSRQFSSCVLIEGADNLDSITEVAKATVSYISQRAGIGLNGGRIRALKSPIRNGEAVHTGLIPFWKLWHAAVKSCSQGALRGGAATLFYPMWHKDFESMIVLKNNKGVEETRIRQLDYGVQLNGYLIRRLQQGQDIMLACPSTYNGALYDAFFADQDEFARLYEMAEKDPSVFKSFVPSMDLFRMLLQERSSTGRIYLQFVDNCNTHSPFDPKLAPIKQSNLCMEIALPTKPVDWTRTEGEIALCTLAAFNVANVVADEYEELSEIVVNALNRILRLQDYPRPEAKRSTDMYRPLGVGVIDLAHLLAREGFKYSDDRGNDFIHGLFERIQFYLMKASVKATAEFGVAEGWGNTRLSKGILPIDTYERNINEFVTNELKMDWEGLRQDILANGMANCTLTALMPSETSSQIHNATNGIEPVLSLVTSKASKDGAIKQVAPNIRTIGHMYETRWEMPDHLGYMRKVSIMQKFVCQAISANDYYNPDIYPNRMIPMQILLRDIILKHRQGHKTAYYFYARDENEDVDGDGGCDGGGCKI